MPSFSIGSKNFLREINWVNIKSLHTSASPPHSLGFLFHPLIALFYLLLYPPPTITVHPRPLAFQTRSQPLSLPSHSSPLIPLSFFLPFPALLSVLFFTNNSPYIRFRNQLVNGFDPVIMPVYRTALITGFSALIFFFYPSIRTKWCLGMTVVRKFDFSTRRVFYGEFFFTPAMGEFLFPSFFMVKSLGVEESGFLLLLLANHRGKYFSFSFGLQFMRPSSRLRLFLLFFKNRINITCRKLHSINSDSSEYWKLGYMNIYFY